jgi:hypothetical protein
MPRAFDGYVEKPVRVSTTCLVTLARNRYHCGLNHRGIAVVLTDPRGGAYGNLKPFGLNLPKPNHTKHRSASPKINIFCIRILLSWH